MPGDIRSRGSAVADVVVDDFFTRNKQLGSSRLAGGVGRLIFGLDSTASRQPAWDAACQLQASMFREAKGLSLQLVYYRGEAECRASRWITQPEDLAGLMEKIECRVGRTQIGKVLAHAKREAERVKISGLVFVGDAMEESADELSGAVGELRRLGVPLFMFQEGDDRAVERVFRDLASQTRGAYCQFDAPFGRSRTSHNSWRSPLWPMNSFWKI
jgi:hypothetical protein